MKFNKDGFLTSWEDWSEAVAEEIAHSDGIQLTQHHWLIITAVRAFYAEFHTTPPLRVLVKLLQQKLGHEQGSSLYLQQLFPPSAAKQIAKISGLPKPKKCI